METLATVILLMVAPSSTDNDLENYSSVVAESPTIQSCQSLADLLNERQSSDVHWWCYNE